MTADIIDFREHLRKKHMEETKEWLKNQGVMPIPSSLPPEIFKDDEDDSE